MDKSRTGFNDTYITSRYKAFKDGEFKSIVTLTNDRKKWYEARGWTFVRTTQREGDYVGSQYQ